MKPEQENLATEHPGPGYPARVRDLPRSVWLLGWASLLTDTATEMIYPLLPVFLTRTLRASVFSVGLIEGVADAASSILKVASGHLSDRWDARRPLVIAGYSLSGAVRPLIALAAAWPHVLALRFVDRVGKGVRGAPRDALLARFAGRQLRGRVFGLHRAMDHAGAIAGPLLASAFLFAYPDRFRTLFALTVIPGVLVVLLLLGVRESPERGGAKPRQAAGAQTAGWRRLPASFLTYLGIILLFTLGNSTDAFLLVKLSETGLDEVWLPLLWAALHVVKSTSALLGGVLADRWHRRRAIALGWGIYAVTYIAFALVDTATTAIAWFLIYGLYFGLTEGPERALIADLARPDVRATAFGWYGAATGIGALAASILFGALWVTMGPATAFVTGATLAGLAAVLILIVPIDGR